MIAYDLACGCGYQFEGWFKSRQDFIRQQEESLLSCPVCGNHDIRKVLSPVRIQTITGSGPQENSPLCRTFDGESTPDVLQVLEELQRYVDVNFEDVGTNLAREALKIHYGVEKPRNIRGVTTPEEERTLKEEGIRMLKLPMPVKNKEPVN